jgi:hypothetical protein
VRWAPWQRLTMGVASRVAPAWRTALLLVQSATVLRWHRAGSARSGDALGRWVAGAHSHGPDSEHQHSRRNPAGPRRSLVPKSSRADVDSHAQQRARGALIAALAPLAYRETKFRRVGEPAYRMHDDQRDVRDLADVRRERAHHDRLVYSRCSWRCSVGRSSRRSSWCSAGRAS